MQQKTLVSTALCALGVGLLLGAAAQKGYCKEQHKEATRNILESMKLDAENNWIYTLLCIRFYLRRDYSSVIALLLILLPIVWFLLPA